MKKKDIELIFKGADEQSWKELLDDLRPQGDLISPLTELCGGYCKNCPVTDENECTDCLITHIRGIIGGKE